MQTEARVGVVMEGGGQIARHQRQQLQQPAHIGAVAHLISGGVAGAFSKTCTAPLSRLTILFQVQGMHSDAATLRKASIWHEASRIVYEEGFRAFWKGNLVTIAHRLPYSSISFYAYEQYKNLLQLITGLDKQRDSVSADVCVRLLGGGLAGLTAATMTYPLDLVRTRLSAQFHAAKLLEYLVCHRTATSSLDRRCFRKIVLAPLVSSSWITAPSCVPISYRCWSSSPSVFEAISLFLKWPSWCLENTSEGAGSFSDFHLLRDEGIRGLYKGLGATLLGVGPSLAINFCAYETLRSHWQVERPCDSPVLVSLASGSLAGIASSTVTFPLDLVRRRKQLEGAAGRAPVYKTGTFATFGHIIRTEGFRGLYRGILPEYYKVVPSVGIVFMTYETLKSIMS